MSLQPLRIIDANLNRASEGLRLLEDVARFVLNDVTLTQQLRTMRHGLAEQTKPLSIKLLSQRDAEHDIGLKTDKGLSREKTQQYQTDLAGVIIANAKRVGESLRVMEELAKLPQISQVLDSAKLEQARFNVYSLERTLLSKILRQDKIGRLPGLYVILDMQALAGRNELDIASQVIRAGVRVIQLRDKQSNRRELLLKAQGLKTLCAASDVLFIINDYLDLALAADADGLHIGQKDLPLPVARENLPIDKIVGCSVNTVSQATEAQEQGADYIAVGSIFPSTTKKEAIVVGVDTLKQIRQAVSCPLVAIGGINEDNIEQVVVAGADCVAVASTILNERDAETAARQLIARMDLAREKYGNKEKT